MNFLKNRITRGTAFAIACIIVAACAFSAVKTLAKYDAIYDNNDYLCGDAYDNDMNSLFGQLWTIGNMYLRNLDENGDFTGSKELEKSTKKALQELGLMDSNGKITIDNYEILIIQLVGIAKTKSEIQNLRWNLTAFTL